MIPHIKDIFAPHVINQYLELDRVNYTVDTAIEDRFSENLSDRAGSDIESRDQRRFYMGFVTEVPASGTIMDEGLDDLYAFMNKDQTPDRKDMAVSHLEGISWKVAYDESSLSGDAKFYAALTRSLNVLDTDDSDIHPVMINPARGSGVLNYFDASLLMPPEIDGQRLNSTVVKDAFLWTCEETISLLNPTYLAIGAEVNLLNPSVWDDYVELYNYTYDQLKISYPNLPIFASITLHSEDGVYRDLNARSRIEDIIDKMDIIGLSYYPLFETSDRMAPLEWAVEYYKDKNKPFAVTETGDSSSSFVFDIDFTPFGGGIQYFTVNGSKLKQFRYYNDLFKWASSNNVLFVTQWIYKDFNNFWEEVLSGSDSGFTVNSVPIQFFEHWKHAGFYDGYTDTTVASPKAKPAWLVWQEYLNYEKV